MEGRGLLSGLGLALERLPGRRSVGHWVPPVLSPRLPTLSPFPFLPSPQAAWEAWQAMVGVSLYSLLNCWAQGLRTGDAPQASAVRAGFTGGCAAYVIAQSSLFRRA